MDIEDVTEGLRVVYRAHFNATPEHGTVTRIDQGSGYVFVRFDGETSSKACRAGTLTREALTEAEALAADPDDRAEMQAVRAELDALRVRRGGLE